MKSAQAGVGTIGHSSVAVVRRALASIGLPARDGGLTRAKGAERPTLLAKGQSGL